MEWRGAGSGRRIGVRARDPFGFNTDVSIDDRRV